LERAKNCPEPVLMDVVPLRPDDASQPRPPARPRIEASAPRPPQKLRLIRPDSAPDLSAKWESLNSEGTRHFLAGHFVPARVAFDAALELARDFASNDLRLATSLNNLGETHRTLGHFNRAQPLLEEALAQRERVLGPRHPHVARSRNNLGFLHECRAEYFEAFGQYREALTAMSRPPAAYPGELTSTLMHLARLAGVCGAHEQAERLHQAACEVMGVCINAEDPESGLHLHISGQVHEMGGRFRDAWHCYRSAMRVLESALGRQHHLLAPVLAGMGRTLRARGRTSAAESVMHRALAILEATYDEPHPETAGVLNSLAELYRATARDGLAELLYRRALKIGETALGETHPDVAAVLYNLAMLHRQRGEDEAAAELLVQVEQIDSAVQLPPVEAFAKLSTGGIPAPQFPA
jgi:tetratricopeptide (TPR) repeat protein